MKKTDAWMPLWIGSYLGDTQHLSRDEHGGYLLLLMAHWRNQGPLRDDDKRLASIVKATPKEWQALKPVLAEFFTIENGFWTQKRLQKELESSKANVAQKSLAGKASAAKRWGSKDSTHPSNEVGTGVLTEAVTDCQRQGNSTPTTTTLTTATPTSSSAPTQLNPHFSDPKHEAPIESPSVGIPTSTFVEACRAMEQAGLSDCNPSHPILKTLLESGASTNEFQQAAYEAAKRNKGFAYALGIVVNQRKAAAELVLHQGRIPNKQETLEASNRAVGAEWAKKMQQKLEQEQNHDS